MTVQSLGIVSPAGRPWTQPWLEKQQGARIYCTSRMTLFGPKQPKTGIKNRTSQEHCIVIADNAERSYFLQGLLELDASSFLALGRTEEAYRMAAERFVGLARTKIRPAFFIFLTNDENFALSFASFVNAQHNDLLSLEVLPFPSNRDKETAVRVNTNLLNPVTYWFCLDRAGPEGKQKVRDAICGNDTFPASFAAVSEALAKARGTYWSPGEQVCAFARCLNRFGQSPAERLHRTWTRMGQADVEFRLSACGVAGQWMD